MLTNAKIWYGDKEIRVESDGFCAMEIYYTGSANFGRNIPVNLKKGTRKILLWKDYDELIHNESLLYYTGKLKILKARAIDWDLNIVKVRINLENVHLWELMRSDWDYLGKWENFNRSY